VELRSSVQARDKTTGSIGENGWSTSPSDGGDDKYHRDGEDRVAKTVEHDPCDRKANDSHRSTGDFLGFVYGANLNSEFFAKIQALSHSVVPDAFHFPRILDFDSKPIPMEPF
jgi:hypothetical protein